MRASDWQPIETAPHETDVILYCVAGDRRWQEVGFASQGRRVNLGPGRGVASSMSWHGYATHWMPLPDAPEAASLAREREEAV